MKALPIPALPGEPVDAGVQTVLDRYRGVWKRTLLQTPQARDASTTVFWLQTSCWHADIRIPAGRPDFSGVRSLQECDAKQRAWLHGQQGFAGITETWTEQGQELCAWRRIVDFQPPAATADEGIMQFQPGLLIETGVHADYLEHWLPVPRSQDGFAAFRCRSRHAGVDYGERLILMAGDFAMRLRGRTSEADFLDFEISFLRRHPNGWQILHSTLPWIEGETLALNFQPVSMHAATLQGYSEQDPWEIIEWNHPAFPPR